MTLFEMATGALPMPGCDASAIEDPAKRALVSFALRDEPWERPTANALLVKTLELARSASMMRSEATVPSNAVWVGGGWAYSEQKD